MLSFFKPLGSLAGIGLCLFLSAGAWACNTAAGQITGVNSQDHVLTIQQSSDRTVVLKFVLRDDTKVILNGKQGSLADLKAGDKITVDFEKLDDVLVVNATRES